MSMETAGPSHGRPRFDAADAPSEHSKALIMVVWLSVPTHVSGIATVFAIFLFSFQDGLARYSGGSTWLADACARAGHHTAQILEGGSQHLRRPDDSVHCVGRAALHQLGLSVWRLSHTAYIFFLANDCGVTAACENCLTQNHATHRPGSAVHVDLSRRAPAVDRSLGCRSPRRRVAAASAHWQRSRTTAGNTRLKSMHQARRAACGRRIRAWWLARTLALSLARSDAASFRAERCSSLSHMRAAYVHQPRRPLQDSTSRCSSLHSSCGDARLCDPDQRARLGVLSMSSFCTRTAVCRARPQV